MLEVKETVVLINDDRRTARFEPGVFCASCKRLMSQLPWGSFFHCPFCGEPISEDNKADVLMKLNQGGRSK